MSAACLMRTCLYEPTVHAASPAAPRWKRIRLSSVEDGQAIRDLRVGHDILGAFVTVMTFISSLCADVLADAHACTRREEREILTDGDW